jgi:hypothetical protein
MKVVMILSMVFGGAVGYLAAEYRFSERIEAMRTKWELESMKAERQRQSWKDTYWD